MSSTYSNMLYHIVFSTKYRNPMIDFQRYSRTSARHKKNQCRILGTGFVQFRMIIFV